MLRTKLSRRRVQIGMIVLCAVVFPFFVFGAALEDQVIRVAGQIGVRRNLALLYIALLCADVIAPIPSSALSLLSGASLGFAVGAVTTWAGMTLGSAFGYGIGAGFFARWTRPKPSPDARKGKDLSPATLGAVAATRGVPVLAEAVTLLAGAHRLPFLPFMTVSAIANLGVAAAYAYVGAMAANVNSFLLAFGGSIGLPAIALLIHRVVTRRQRGR